MSSLPLDAQGGIEGGLYDAFRFRYARPALWMDVPSAEAPAPVSEYGAGHARTTVVLQRSRLRAIVDSPGQSRL